ncbi:hypothetical protein GE300_17150 [Rhodobacteraceae bacterium 2CG4]|uniref:Uncharacterized protein n=1 Tax=Halovulum marinum TaxID=2662447 RepID=A0A6L5Z3Z5_9RHOB|nr:hypothetical protein [Halovulum marinum]MSU91311.1 hypothetical protein [Halovulum marinum]
MSGIRPEVRARLRRWLEPVLWAAAALPGLWLAWRGAVSGGWVAVLAGAGIAAVGAMGLLAWLRRARFSGAALAVGVVDITEARIGYYAPEGGRFVDLGALSRLEMVPRRDGTRAWVLHHDDGPPVQVPLGARGAERLIDLFAALPGLRIDLASAALDRDGSFTVWKRSDPGKLTGTRVARPIGKH